MDSKLKAVGRPSFWEKTDRMWCNIDTMKVAFKHCLHAKLHSSKQTSHIVLVFLLLNLNKF